MYGESVSMQAAREVAEKIDKIVRLYDLKKFVIVRVDDGKFNFYPDAFVVTWMDYFFIYQEHQRVEVHHKEEAEVTQLTEVEIEPLEGWLWQKSCMYAQIGNMDFESLSALVREYAPGQSLGESDAPSAGDE